MSKSFKKMRILCVFETISMKITHFALVCGPIQFSNDGLRQSALLRGRYGAVLPTPELDATISPEKRMDQPFRLRVEQFHDPSSKCKMRDGPLQDVCIVATMQDLYFVLQDKPSEIAVALVGPCRKVAARGDRGWQSLQSRTTWQRTF